MPSDKKTPEQEDRERELARLGALGKGHVRDIANKGLHAGRAPFGAEHIPGMDYHTREEGGLRSRTSRLSTVYEEETTPPPRGRAPLPPVPPTPSRNGGIRIQFDSEPFEDEEDPPRPPRPPRTPPVPPNVPPATKGAPKGPASFIATPGVPRRTRVIVASRADQMYGTMGNTADLVSWGKRETMTGDTLSVFLPHYQHFVREFGNINALGLTPTQLDQARYVLSNHKGILNAGLLDSLDSVKPGLSETLYHVLLAQFAEGQSGIKENITSFSDSPLIARLNDFGFGTHLQGEMLHVLDNSEFFSSTDLNINGKDFTLDHTDPAGNAIPLIKGHVDESSGQVSFKIDPNVPPQLKDLAIKHLVMMVASHTQQNDSNLFNINFGDNPYENLRILQLAIGAYNLHVPRSLIDSYIQKLPNYVSDEVKNEFNYWANHSEVFLARLAQNGSKIVNETQRPQDGFGRQSMAKIQAEMLEHVTEDIFPPAPRQSMGSKIS